MIIICKTTECDEDEDDFYDAVDHDAKSHSFPEVHSPVSVPFCLFFHNKLLNVILFCSFHDVLFKTSEACAVEKAQVCFFLDVLFLIQTQIIGALFDLEAKRGIWYQPWDWHKHGLKW